MSDTTEILQEAQAPEQPSLEIEFDEELTEEQRDAARASIETMIRYSTAGMEQQSTTDAHEARLRAAVQAPLNKLIESDPAALKAMETVADLARQQAEAYKPTLPVFPTRQPQDTTIQLPADVRALQNFYPPFHFFWRWHGGQAPYRSEVNRQYGTVALAAAPGSNQVTNAHAGFGVLLTTDRLKTVVARTTRMSNYSYLVSGGYFGGSATAEGGIIMSVMENGQLLKVAADKRFRRRASNGESFSGSGDFELGQNIELTFTMFPGSQYALNVGAWVFCENQHGVGASGFSYVNSSVGAKILLMSVFE